MRIRLLFASVSALFLAGAIHAQPTDPYQTMTCIKVNTGKAADYRQLVADVSIPMAQARANAGEILSWSLLRSVMPAGAEARCDYIISTIYPGIPSEPTSQEGLAADMKKAGVKMTANDYLARRGAITRLVAQEMWRVRVRVGQPQKGNYAFINYMKVLNAADYIKFETEVWRGLAEQWIKDGAQSGWAFSTLILPSGTGAKYAAYSVDIYPNWAAAFAARKAEETFKKAYPGKDFAQAMSPLTKLRDLAERDLMVYEQRVTKK